MSIPSVIDVSRGQYFAKILQSMQRCETYDGLECFCSSVTIPYAIGKITPIYKVKESQNDNEASKLVPEDVPGAVSFVHITVNADGDCLSHLDVFLHFEMKTVQQK